MVNECCAVWFAHGLVNCRGKEVVKKCMLKIVQVHIFRTSALYKEVGKMLGELSMIWELEISALKFHLGKLLGHYIKADSFNQVSSNATSVMAE